MGTLPGGATDIEELPQPTRKAQLASTNMKERIRYMIDPPAFRTNVEATCGGEGELERLIPSYMLGEGNWLPWEYGEA
jgi:hypothetical protein